MDRRGGRRWSAIFGFSGQLMRGWAQDINSIEMDSNDSALKSRKFSAFRFSGSALKR